MDREDTDAAWSKLNSKWTEVIVWSIWTASKWGDHWVDSARF